MASNLNDFSIIYIDRGFLELPQQGPEVDNTNPNDFYAICMIKTRIDLTLGL